MAVHRWSEVAHLARRARWSLRRPSPDPAHERWLLGLLTPAEGLLYRSMDRSDRAHAVACAAAVRGHQRDVVVASALHDVGKTEAGLGTLGRIAATMCGLTRAVNLAVWGLRTGRRRQISAYLDHPRLGADALLAVGAPDLAVVWALEHHLEPHEWSIDPALGAALRLADDE